MFERCSRSDQGTSVVQRSQRGSVGGKPMGRNHQGVLCKLRGARVPHCAIVLAADQTEKDGSTGTIWAEGETNLQSYIRYGRRIQLPSTVSLKHELRALIAEENVRELCAEAEGLPLSASWNEIESRRRPLSSSGAL